MNVLHIRIYVLCTFHIFVYYECVTQEVITVYSSFQLSIVVELRNWLSVLSDRPSQRTGSKTFNTRFGWITKFRRHRRRKVGGEWLISPIFFDGSWSISSFGLSKIGIRVSSIVGSTVSTWRGSPIGTWLQMETVVSHPSANRK